MGDSQSSSRWTPTSRPHSETGGPYPARNPDENVADIQAQIAANEKGMQLLDELLAAYPIEIEELVFGERSKLLIDSSEERLKSEFEGVRRTYVPLHSVLRVDEVEKAVQG